MAEPKIKMADIIADLVARFVVGFGAAIGFTFLALYISPRLWIYEWKLMLLFAGVVGLVYAIFGLRKGPGVI